jgi:hypothetical protein
MMLCRFALPLFVREAPPYEMTMTRDKTRLRSPLTALVTGSVQLAPVAGGVVGCGGFPGPCQGHGWARWWAGLVLHQGAVVTGAVAGAGWRAIRRRWRERTLCSGMRASCFGRGNRWSATTSSPINLQYSIGDHQ